MDISGKNIVLTGASSGLGAATAEALVHKKSRVYGLARNVDKLNLLQDKLGENFIPVPLDITDTSALRKWADSTFSDTHFPEVLINNAGVSRLEEVDNLSDDEWNLMLDTNLSAVHFLTTTILPWMKKDSDSSHIINIGSILGKVSGSKKAAYSATKFAIRGYSEALFKELRGYNIKVTCINPGSINTHFFENSGISPNSRMLSPIELADIIRFVLETPENVLIDELTVRPLRPKRN